MCYLCDEYNESQSPFCATCKFRNKCSPFERARKNYHGDCAKFQFECPKGVELT